MHIIARVTKVLIFNLTLHKNAVISIIVDIASFFIEMKCSIVKERFAKTVSCKSRFDVEKTIFHIAD